MGKEYTVASTRVEMSEVMTPNDANFLGKVFGGRILSLLDLVAYATASRYAGMVCVTASFDRVDFHSPIEVGELVRCIGQVFYVGRTSVEVTIQVYSNNVFTSVERHTNTARVTMVAIDKEGKPQPVPRLICETSNDKVRFLEGRLRRELRAAQRQDYEQLAKRFSEANEAVLDHYLSLESLI